MFTQIYFKNQTKIRLYLPFSDWFEIKRTPAWFQTENQTQIPKWPVDKIFVNINQNYNK